MITDAEHLASWVGRLVRIPSVNPQHAGPRSGPGGEEQYAQALAGWFRELGADTVELHEIEPGRPNVYGIWEGRTDRWLVLDSHTDTVTVEHCTGDPFDGRIADGRVYGRGAVDTKASMGTMLAVLEAARAEGLAPRHNLVLVGTVSEEAGGLIGAEGFRTWAEARGLRPTDLIVAEPTMCAPIYGHKGGVSFDVEITGASAHSATPHLGRNAITAAAHLIVALDEEHRRLQTLDADTEVGRGTLTVTLVNGGTGGNVVPDRCTLTVGRRVVPFEDNEVVAAELAALIERSCPLPVTFTRTYLGTGAFYQSPDSELVRRIADWAGSTPEVAPYGTNALRYHGFAENMVVFGPGSIDDAHKAVEFVTLDELARCADVFTRWIEPTERSR